MPFADLKQRALQLQQDEGADGATAAATPAEAARGADEVVTMLPSSPHVRDVYTSEGVGIIVAALKDPNGRLEELHLGLLNQQHGMHERDASVLGEAFLARGSATHGTAQGRAVSSAGGRRGCGGSGYRHSAAQRDHGQHHRQLIFEAGRAPEPGRTVEGKDKATQLNQ